MEGVEAVEVQKLYAFVRAFFGTHLNNKRDTWQNCFCITFVQ